MSEIKYPCVMQYKRGVHLVVWFTAEHEGIVLETEAGGWNVGEQNDGFSSMDSYEPYVRPKEYEYQVLYKCKDSFMLGLTNNFYKDANEFEARNFRLSGYDSIEMLEQSRREVK